MCGRYFINDTPVQDVYPSQQAIVLAADPNLPGNVITKQMIWGFPVYRIKDF